MNRIKLPLLLLLCLFRSRSTHAQDFYAYFNTDTFWRRIVLDPPGMQVHPAEPDTSIIVVSNRARGADSVRFMSELPDRKELRYFFVYTYGGQWHVLPVKSLSEALSLVPRPNRDWVVYTEGMGKIFTSDVDRGMRMAAQFGVNVLLLDYPGIRSHYKALRNYKFALANARHSYEHFVPVLDSFKQLRLQQKAGTGHLSLFFHSMGNNLPREIVRHHLLFLFNNTVWVDNIILNAPCVPRKGHREWIDQIHFAKRIYIHFNPRDNTLKWARIVGFHQILGEHVKRPLSRQAIYINFHPLAGDSHSNFLLLYSRPPAPPEAVQHYKVLFHGAGVNLQDEHRYGPGSYRGIGYDILPVSRF